MRTRAALLLAGLLAVPAASSAAPISPPVAPPPEVQPAAGDDAATFSALFTAGAELFQAKQYDGAVAQWQLALARAEALKDVRGQVSTLTVLGVAQMEGGHAAAAMESARQGIARARAAGQPELAAPPLHVLGEIYSRQEQPQRAAECYLQAIPLLQKPENRKSLASALEQLGACYQRLGKAQQALSPLNQALHISEASDGKISPAPILLKLALAREDLGDTEQARDLAQRALSLCEAAGDRGGQANALTVLGGIDVSLQATLQGLDALNRALALHRALDDRDGQAQSLNSLGLLYRSLGQTSHAVELLTAAVEIQVDLKKQRDLATTLYNLGLCYDALGEPEQAAEFYQRARPRFQEVGDKLGEAYVTNAEGNDYAVRHQTARALETLRQALELARQSGDRDLQATVLINISAAYHDLKAWTQAWQYGTEAVALTHEGTARSLECTALTNLGAVEEAQGHSEPAGSHMRAAVQIAEELREGLGSLSEAKMSLLESNLATYHMYTDWLLRHDTAAAAFTWAEKAKARTLVDLMAAGHVDISGSLSTEERRHEAELKQTLRDLNATLIAEATGARDAALTQQTRSRLEQATRDLQAYTVTLYAAHPELARQRVARTVDAEQVANFLPADTALLDYAVLHARNLDAVVLFCITTEQGRAQVRAYRLKQSSREVAEQADDFRAACSDPTRSYRVKAHALYDSLVAPAAAQLAGKRRLLICPDGPLWGLPFQALMPSGGAGDDFLIQQYEITYAYSATAADAALAGRTTPPWAAPAQLLAFANPDFGGPERLAGAGDATAAPDGGATGTAPDRPIRADARAIRADSRAIIARSRGLPLDRRGAISPLPGTAREAEALRGLFPDAVLRTGTQAQEADVKAEAGGYRLLHFATHGWLNDAAPLMSSIVLAEPPAGSAEDGFLTAQEIFDLQLDADLVVLSACNTAQGEQRNGEGVLGLTWAFFVAGAHSQIVSQWPVNDDSTAELMGRLYAQLKQNAPKAAALRSAELALLQSPPYSHPYYWAPFVQIGDWR